MTRAELQARALGLSPQDRLDLAKSILVSLKPREATEGSVELNAWTLLGELIEAQMQQWFEEPTRVADEAFWEEIRQVGPGEYNPNGLAVPPKSFRSE